AARAAQLHRLRPASGERPPRRPAPTRRGHRARLEPLRPGRRALGGLPDRTRSAPLAPATVGPALRAARASGPPPPRAPRPRASARPPPARCRARRRSRARSWCRSASLLSPRRIVAFALDEGERGFRAGLALVGRIERRPVDADDRLLD